MSEEFKIGDLVNHRALMHDCMQRAKMGELTTPTSGVITEVWTQQCHGGVQTFYLVSIPGSDKPVKVIALEITKDLSWSDIILTTYIKGYERRRNLVKAAKEQPPTQEETK